MIQNTIDFQFFSPIQFNKKFNKKFWDKIQFNKIFNKKILDKIQFKTLFNSRIFNSKFDSKYWNWQDSIQQHIHSIRKRGYRSPLSEWERKSCFILCASSHSNDFSCISQSCCCAVERRIEGLRLRGERRSFYFVLLASFIMWAPVNHRIGKCDRKNPWKFLPMQR